MPREEGHLEHLARLIVSAELNRPVERFDFGSASAQVDAVIVDTEMRVPVEVVSDTDSAFESQWTNLEKRGRTVAIPGSATGWFLSVRHSANINAIRRGLSDVMASAETQILASDTPGFVPDVLRALGVTYAAPLSDRPEVAILSSEGWNSWDDPVDLNSWVERTLQRNADVARKLQAFGDGVEAHVFIWARPGSAWSVRHALRDEDETLPDDGPDLPDGISDVWVSITSEGLGAIRYSNGQWKRAGAFRVPGTVQDRAVSHGQR